MAYNFGKNVDTKGRFDALSDKVNIITAALLILVLSIYFSLSGLLMDYFARKQASYDNLQNEVQSQNAKIDYLIKELERNEVIYGK